jgi:hypothetical protein
MRCVELRSEARTTRCDRSKKEKPGEAGRRVASDTVQQAREGFRRSSGREEKCKRDNCGSRQHSFRTSIASKATIRRQVCRLEIALAAPSSPRRADPQRSPPRASWAQNEIGAAASGASKGVHQRSLFLSLGSSPT